MKKLSMKHLVAGLLLGICGTSSFSYAGNRANSASVTVGAGYDYFASRRHIENTGMPLIGVGYNFTDRWGIEALLGGFNTDFKKSQNDSRGINGTLFAIDGVYRFSPYKNIIEPFVLAGVGVIGMNPSGNDAHNQGNINAAVGAQIFIHPLVAFRFEARDFYTIVGGKNDVMLDAGVTFLINAC